ncbi:hypothetical protein [Flavobacterium aurantiibacter]|uniref:Ig-like domain-containing protein n=1 Tax=Flavobacterium aurantiibacter TaxID=2023067 RepID=A0A256A4A5_9FLAO|nr:hypothetical protein [Flavobacterium aurantiibacter]OYQ48502.1 hypothetical protein CHX27_02185 [Flavobacterium aurantiibacter]
MKKFLILLLITLPSFAFCQAVITLSFCNGGGIIESSVFTTWQPDYNPDTHLVTLHNTYVDAAENLNGIPSSTVITASQTKFVRILNLQTGEVSIGTIIVIVNPPMEVSLAATLDSPTSSVMCYTFGGTPPYYFQWSIDGVIQTEGDTSMILIPTSNAVSEISCVVTDSSTNPCQAMASIQITPYTPINADALSILVDDTEIVTSTASVFYNDYLNYQSLTFPAIQQQVYLEETGEGWDNFNLNASGTISALPGTPAGTYNLQYSVFHVNGGFVGSASINLQVFSSAVQLIAFVDWDGNGIKSDDEPLFVEGKFLISGSDGTELELYSDTGTYVYNTLSNITYGLSYQVNDGSLPVFSCGTSFLDINPIAGSTTTYFFPINSTPAINGVVSLVSYQTPSPGFTRYYEVKVKNIGSLPIVNAVLNVQKPDYSTLVSYCNTCIATA